MNEKAENRIVYLDIVRTVALFCVIGVHWAGTVREISPDGILYQITNDVLDTINGLGVPIFFSLSGYLILQKNIDNIRRFYIQRLIRLGIPYLVYAVIYVVYFTGIEEKTPGKIPAAYVYDILTAQVHGTHWFVFSLLGLTFATPFISKMLKTLTNQEISILFIGSLILTLFSDIYSLLGQTFPLEGKYVFCGSLLYYICGYCTNRMLSEESCKWGDVIKKLSPVLIILFLIIQIIHSTAVVTTIIAALILSNVREIKTGTGVSEALASVSRYSYSIYLIHAAAVSLLWRIYRSTDIGYLFKLFSGYIIVFMISLVVAVIIDWLILDRLMRLSVAKL